MLTQTLHVFPQYLQRSAGTIHSELNHVLTSPLLTIIQSFDANYAEVLTASIMKQQILVQMKHNAILLHRRTLKMEATCSSETPVSTATVPNVVEIGGTVQKHVKNKETHTLLITDIQRHFLMSLCTRVGTLIMATLL
jgi:hypothetical protein